MSVDVERLRELAIKATPQEFDSAQIKDDDGWAECPACGGEGSVELHADYCNYDGAALGVQFYGIGDAHVNAEAYYRAANPAAVLALIERLEKAERDGEEQFRKGFWWGFERARCHPEQMNIRSEYEDVKELRSRNKGGSHD